MLYSGQLLYSAAALLPWLVQVIDRRISGGWIMGCPGWLCLIDGGGGTPLLGNPVDGAPHMTMNDGAVGPDGRTLYVTEMCVNLISAFDCNARALLTAL